MNLTDKDIDDIIGDIDTEAAVPLHKSEALLNMGKALTEMFSDIEDEEEALLMAAALLNPMREFMDLEELDPEDEGDAFILKAFEFSDKHNKEAL